MPMYSYACKHCGLTVEVIRMMREYDVGPDDREVSDADKEKKHVECSHEFSREITSAPTKHYAAGWGWDRKGNY